MSVTLTLDLERLKEPKVAQALANLFLALSDESTVVKVAPVVVPAPAAIAAPVAAPVAAPAVASVVAAPAAVTAPAPAPVVATPAALVAAPVVVPAVRKTRKALPPIPPPGSGDRAAFLASMPERTQRFVALVEAKGLVTMTDAMQALGMTQPKAMGGLTGALSRWSRQRGVTLPFEAIKVNDQRAWRWTDGPSKAVVADAPAPAAKSAEIEETSTTAPAIRRRKRKPQRVVGKVAKPQVPAAAPKAVAVAGSDENYTNFISSLKDRPRRFLELVEAKGTVTLPEVVAALEIDRPKAMGGVTGSLARWAPVRGVSLPYETIEIDGVRAWRWIRGAAAAAPAAAPAPAPAKASTTDEPDLEAFFAELPERSSRFARLLHEKGTLTMPEVLESFGLSRAKAVGGIIEPLKRLGEKHGMVPAYTIGSTEDGQKTWSWPV